MNKKLTKVPPARTLAIIGDTDYIVLSNGTVARLLKPTVINDHPYYNICVNRRLTRMSGRRLLEAAKIA